MLAEMIYACSLKLQQKVELWQSTDAKLGVIAAMMTVLRHILKNTVKSTSE